MSVIVPENICRSKLKSGQFVLGTMLVHTRQPVVMNILEQAGYDFVIIDNEHGVFTNETISDLSVAARNANITPIVRVTDGTYTQVAQALDGGVQGIMLPRVYTVDQVQDVAKIMKYPPEGMRGCAAGRASNDFQRADVGEFMEGFNREGMLLVQVETTEILEHLDEVAAIDAVDVLFVGPNDLSIAFGVPGQVKDSRVTDACQRVIETCKKHGKTPGLQVNVADDLAGWKDRGMQMLSAGSEMGFLGAGARLFSGPLKG
jgi:2-keto-3-deoxy-L-rhamnonate aldolase RhmA